jgi:transposase
MASANVRDNEDRWARVNPCDAERAAQARRGGWDRLDARKRGGRPPKLDGRALRWIYHTLSSKNQQRLTFPLALWTAAMVRTPSAERCQAKLGHSSVC